MTEYVRSSDTSYAAAVSIEPKAGSLRKQVLDFIRARGRQGSTCEEVEIGLGMKHQTASARIRELHDGGFIVDSGERRKNTSGCKARVMKVPDQVCWHPHNLWKDSLPKNGRIHTHCACGAWKGSRPAGDN